VGLLRSTALTARARERLHGGWWNDRGVLWASVDYVAEHAGSGGRHHLEDSLLPDRGVGLGFPLVVVLTVMVDHLSPDEKANAQPSE